MDVDIGANPSAEGGDEDEGVENQAVKVVDIVDTFRLQVRNKTLILWKEDLSIIIHEHQYKTNGFRLFTGATCFWQEAICYLHEEVHQVADTETWTREARVVQEAHWGSYQVLALKAERPPIVCNSWFIGSIVQTQ